MTDHAIELTEGSDRQTQDALLGTDAHPTESIQPSPIPQPDCAPATQGPPVEQLVDWSQLTVAQLKAELDRRGLVYPNSATKADLVGLLNQPQA